MDATLLQDLTEYKSHHDKGFMFVSRSLITVFREVNPELLKRKDRRKAVSISLKDLRNRTAGSVQERDGRRCRDGG
ncbi:SDA1-domain-containing protein [Jimgerdemannia flammicorona]|uniref:Protein SDA1 n=1 Tax=Jimgerdemannia flammicorona TaxID=994334 RepID=A0A433Q5Q9_9FUNG|nr:SDA1-domain-containing protein [Jimgerdemannia flammicorona]